MSRQATTDRKQQLLLRSMVNGSISERDRLITYTLGEFFQEFSLFLIEAEEKNKEQEKIKRRMKNFG